MCESFTVAVPGDEGRILALVQETIEAVYPNYYPRAVVDFFLAHHDPTRIAEDVAQKNTWLLTVDGAPVGTGSIHGNEICRVFVAPAAQGRGYGRRIMDALEAEIARGSDLAVLDASLPACGIYERRGYRCAQHMRVPVPGGAFLVYEFMEKRLRHSPLAIELTSPADARFQALCRALDRHLDAAAGRAVQRNFYDQLNAPADLLAVALAVEDGEAVGCGGFKAHGADVAELKRMFVRPACRGRGYAARVVSALEDEARRQGFRRMFLETGRMLTSAQSLYARLGYRVIENYGPYAGLETSVCMEKEL